MPAEWYIESAEGEIGPLPLEQLVERAKSGTLLPTDRVHKGTQIGMRAQNVAALAAVFQTEDAAQPVAIPRQSTPRQTKTPASQTNVAKPRLREFLQGELSSRVVRWGCGVLVIFSVAAISGWLSSSDPTFPKPVSIPADIQSPQRTAARANALLPSRPVVPSIPGLRKGVAHAVPGLENLATAYSPTLTADLCTIVFAAMGNPETGYDLYLANRKSLGAPFGAPELIKSCASPETDAYSSVSSDGLELLFVRSDAKPVIMYSRRDSREREFSEPIEWEVSRLHAADKRVDSPHFLGRSSVMFARLTATITDRELLVVSRPVDSMQFNEPQAISVIDRSCLYALATNQLRAYFGGADGISFVVRSSLSRPFAAPRLLITADITGPVDGTIWVSPKEDLIVFCSPGAGQPPLSSRKLWMVQF